MLLLVVLLPALLIQGFIYYRWHETRLSIELNANLEMARAVSMSVRGYIRDIRRQEETRGMAFLLLKPSPERQMDRLLSDFASTYDSIRSSAVMTSLYWPS